MPFLVDPLQFDRFSLAHLSPASCLQTKHIPLPSSVNFEPVNVLGLVPTTGIDGFFLPGSPHRHKWYCRDFRDSSAFPRPNSDLLAGQCGNTRRFDRVVGACRQSCSCRIST